MNSQRGSISKQTSNGPNSPPGEGSGSNTSPTDSAHTMPSSSNHQEQFQMAPPVQAPQRQQSYSTSIEQYSHAQLPPMQVQPGHSSQQLQQAQQGQQVQGGAPVDSQLAGQTSYNSYQSSYGTPSTMDHQTPSNGNRRYSTESQYSRSGSVNNGYAQHQQLPVGAMPPPPQPSQASNQAYAQSYQSSSSNVNANSNFRTPQAYPTSTLPALPPFSMPQSYGAGSTRSSQTMSPPPNPMDQYQMPNVRTNSVGGFDMMDQYGNSYAIPVCHT